MGGLARGKLRHPTPLPGAYVIDLEKLEDERGFFARSWCQREVD